MSIEEARIDLITCLGREAAGDHHRAAEAQQRHTQRPAQQRADDGSSSSGPFFDNLPALSAKIAR
jgi:hypothetical protein